MCFQDWCLSFCVFRIAHSGTYGKILTVDDNEEYLVPNENICMQRDWKQTLLSLIHHGSQLLLTLRHNPNHIQWYQPGTADLMLIAFVFTEINELQRTYPAGNINFPTTLIPNELNYIYQKIFNNAPIPKPTISNAK